MPSKRDQKIYPVTLNRKVPAKRPEGMGGVSEGYNVLSRRDPEYDGSERPVMRPERDDDNSYPFFD